MREELARQLARRRTRVVLAGLVVIPALLALVLAVRGAPEVPPGGTPQLAHLAAGSALAFAVYVLYLCAPLLLVALGALFGGELVATDAGWGTLRYLLAAPVPRPRLLARKLAAALVLTALATLVLTLAALLAGLVAFGWHALDTPVGGTIAPVDGTLRLVGATVYVLVTLLPFVALAFWFSCEVDAPLAAVGGSVGVAVVAQLLDTVPSLGRARVVLPTHYAYAWTDLFVDPPHIDDLASGALQAAIVTVAACAIAWVRFCRRDITS